MSLPFHIFHISSLHSNNLYGGFALLDNAHRLLAIRPGSSGIAGADDTHHNNFVASSRRDMFVLNIIYFNDAVFFPIYLTTFIPWCMDAPRVPICLVDVPG